MKKFVNLTCVMLLLTGTSMVFAHKNTVTRNERFGAFAKGVACGAYASAQAYFASTVTKDLVKEIIDDVFNGKDELPLTSAIVISMLLSGFAGIAWTGVKAGQISYNSFKKALSAEEPKVLIETGPVVVRKK